MHTEEVIVLCGLPCAGKTTWLREYMVQHEGVAVICRDQIISEMLRDADLIARINDRSKKVLNPISKLYASLRENARNDEFTREYVVRITSLIQACQVRICIIDGLHAQRISREFIRAFPHAVRRAVYLSTSADTCVARFRGLTHDERLRRKQLTEQLIYKLADIFESPHEDEGFDSVVSCSYE